MLKFWWSIGIVRTLIQRSKCSCGHPHENVYFWSSYVCPIVIKTICNWNQSCYFTLCLIAYYILNIHYLLVMVLYSYIVCTTVVWHEKKSYACLPTLFRHALNYVFYALVLVEEKAYIWVPFSGTRFKAIFISLKRKVFRFDFLKLLVLCIELQPQLFSL